MLVQKCSEAVMGLFEKPPSSIVPRLLGRGEGAIGMTRQQDPRFLEQLADGGDPAGVGMRLALVPDRNVTILVGDLAAGEGVIAAEEAQAGSPAESSQ